MLIKLNKKRKTPRNELTAKHAALQRGKAIPFKHEFPFFLTLSQIYIILFYLFIDLFFSNNSIKFLIPLVFTVYFND